jgi:hypothetical protein
MIKAETDERSEKRQTLDEQIAAEPPLPPLDLSSNARGTPMEKHLPSGRRLVAIAGIVENGLVPPLDPSVTLPDIRASSWLRASRLLTKSTLRPNSASRSSINPKNRSASEERLASNS